MFRAITRDRFHGFLAIAALALLTPAWAETGDEPDASEPPLVGQPSSFTASGEAIGAGFTVKQLVSAATVRVDEPVTLTLRITAERSQRPPRRPRLAELKVYKDLIDRKVLQIDPPVLKARGRPDRAPGPRTWEFDYRLRPLTDRFTALPRLPLTYYKPPGSSALPGSYEVAYADAVPITVTPRPEQTLVAPPPVRVPDGVLDLAEGPAVLRRDRTTVPLPALPLLAVLGIAPPLVALAWWAVWRRLYPDAARLLRMQQSRAARTALQALDSAKDASVAAITALYLRQRVGLPSAEPTPAEVGIFLRRAGASDLLAGRATELFRACDAVRFAPAPPAAAEELSSAARCLILTLEAEPWSASAL